jgi:long-subunit acyl-CoA synthetase (AMP-forming)
MLCLLEGYGRTETCAAATLDIADVTRLGAGGRRFNPVSPIYKAC